MNGFGFVGCGTRKEQIFFLKKNERVSFHLISCGLFLVLVSTIFGLVVGLAPDLVAAAVT